MLRDKLCPKGKKELDKWTSDYMETTKKTTDAESCYKVFFRKWNHIMKCKACQKGISGKTAGGGRRVQRAS